MSEDSRTWPGATTGSDIQIVLDSTTDPAFAVDAHGRVTGWNRAAEQLLGYRGKVVIGRPCFRVIRGRDVFGNPYCTTMCPLRTMAKKGQPLRHFQMEIGRSDATTIRVLCFVIVVPGSGSGTFSLVHLLRPLDYPLSPWPEREDADPPALTERELEVLRHLASGYTTHDMAELMSITSSTVRKHVQNLLRKLGVGSRLAAVVTALEQRILA